MDGQIYGYKTQVLGGKNTLMYRINMEFGMEIMQDLY